MEKFFIRLLGLVIIPGTIYLLLSMFFYSDVICLFGMLLYVLLVYPYVRDFEEIVDKDMDDDNDVM